MVRLREIIYMYINTPIIPLVSSAPQDSRPVAIYVHGLASGAKGTTFNMLARKMKEYRWITTDFYENIATNVFILEYLIRHNNPELIVGTSMGGLTVLYAYAPNVVKIVCNPALSIADCVRNKIGYGEHEYFCGRLNWKQTFELTEEMCAEYDEYVATHQPLPGKESYAIFSTNDELLGDEAARTAQEIVTQSGYNTHIDPMGVHRITSSTIKLIRELIIKE